MKTEYHPDPEINEEVAQEAVMAEVADLKAGFPASAWRCPECSVAHSRGFFPDIGSHRCLACGYVGAGGVIEQPTP